MPRRLILDLSDIYNFLAGEGRLTGVQRLELNLAMRLMRRGGIDVVAGYYDPAFGVYARFPATETLDDLERLRESLAFEHVRPLRSYKYRTKPLRGALHYARVRAGIAFRRHIRPWLGSRGARPAPEPLAFRDGDVILLLGSGWQTIDMYRALEPFVRRGVVTPIALVHDLSHIVLKGEQTGLSAAVLEGWVRDVSRFVDRYLSYSESTRTDFLAFCRELGIDENRVETFPLAHEFQPGNADAVRPGVAALSEVRYVLSVGPVAGRKNGDRLVAAWARLAAELGRDRMPALVFAGGSRRDDLTEPAANDLGDLVRFVERPNDAELEQLYRHALFTVYPSLYEGWGLPIGESLWFGKLCVTSGTSSMPEVGGAFCDYFDPYDVDSMATALRRPVAEAGYLERREAEIDRSRLRSWDESADALLAAVARLEA